MKKIKILDCTLRDGGSVNNWLFGASSIAQILQLLNNSNIDIIETGFIDNNVLKNNESCINPNADYFNNLSSAIIGKKSSTVAMIDLSKYNCEDFNISFSDNLNGIRLMFKKNAISKTLEICQKLQSLNYKVSLNPVSITSYSKSELFNLLKSLNEVNPQTVYIVDTYGLLDKNETIYYYNLFNETFNENISIGYHAHNNMQLAFSNSVEIINQKDDRNIVIDSSLYGMGKRAGNVPTELIAQYLNEKYFVKYNIDFLLDAIENYILPIYKKYEWGYSVIHYIAAKNKCHSDYVSYLYNDKKLSFSMINQLLEKMQNEKKLMFDKKYVNLLLGEFYEKSI